jgi:hypothetical protein
VRELAVLHAAWADHQTERPALVHSRITSRSNSAMPANTVMMNFPTWEVVSAHGSESD